MTEDETMPYTMSPVDARDPLECLRAVVALRRLADRLEAQYVAAARRSGITWDEVGDALGVSRQAAHKKFRRL